MRTRKSEIVNGVAGLSVLAMFAVAIVAGESRASLDRSAQAEQPGNQTSRIVYYLEQSDNERFEALPAIVEALAKMPIQVEFDTQKGRILATPKTSPAGDK